MLELWHFALRHYLNLGFKSGMFWMLKNLAYFECTWWREVGRGDIFVNPAWAPVKRHEPDITSWNWDLENTEPPNLAVYPHGGAVLVNTVRPGFWRRCTSLFH